MGKRMVALSIIALLLVSAVVVVPAAAEIPTIADVSGHWAQEEIQQVYVRGIMQGIGTDEAGQILFAPRENVTQAQLVVALTRVFGLEPLAEDKSKSAGANAWYGEAARIMAAYGIFPTDDLFTPERPVTRLEVARAIDQGVKALEIPVFTTQIWPQYEDWNEVDQAGKIAIAFVFNAGIMQGHDNRFKPSASITRAELACVLERTAAMIAGVTEEMKIGTENMSAEIQAWAQENKMVEGIHQQQFGAFDVYMLAMGEKPTGGYSIVIHNAWRDQDDIYRVKAQYQYPNPGDAVIMVITYPYELIAIPAGSVMEIEISTSQVISG